MISAIKKNLGMLQVCRGIAATMVVLCHLSGSTETYFATPFLNDFFIRGYIGVDFFFVLSGFIVTYVHYKDLQNGSNRSTFLKKRIIRIYPIYWVVLSVYIVLLFLVNGKTIHLTHQIDFTSPKDLAFLFFSYFLIHMDPGYLLSVSWSLSYEMIFYLAFYVALSVGLGPAKKLAVLWFVSIITYSVVGIFTPTPEIMLLNSRMAGLLAGCYIAYLVLNGSQMKTMVWNVMFLIGLVILISIFPSKLEKPEGIFTLIYLMSLLIYKLALVDLRGNYNYSKILLLIGNASYSIYLSHLIFLSGMLRLFRSLVAMFHISNYYLLQLLFVTIFLLIMLGGISVYLFIEAPLLKYTNRKLFPRLTNQSLARQSI